MQLCVYRVNGRGLSRLPCGDLVLRAQLDEQKGTIFTVCGRFVRKSLILVQVEVFRLHSFLTRLPEMMVLNAELKSMKSILT